MSSTAIGNDLTFSLLRPSEALGSAELRECWSQLLTNVNHLHRIYASPTWFEHLQGTHPDGALWLAVVRNGTGQPVGICPILLHDIPLLYDVASRILHRWSFEAADILGSEPMLPAGPGAHRLLFEGILREIPSCQCVYLDAMPINSDTGRTLHDHPGRDRAYVPYVEGDRRWHWIELGGTFDQYLQKMSSKARGNLRRMVRDLRDHGGGVKLLRVESEDQVEGFLDSARKVSVKSWQHRVLGERISAAPDHARRLVDLAKRGVLRSYLLESGGVPCAFLVGYQFEGVYQDIETGFDEELADLSPGTVLLYMIIEDLCTYAPPSAFNFGVGDGGYKRRFATDESRDASVFLFRNTSANRLRLASHRAFRLAGRLAKRLLRRKVTK